MARNFIAERTMADPRERAADKRVKSAAQKRRRAIDQQADAVIQERMRWCRRKGCDQLAVGGDDGWWPCCSGHCLRIWEQDLARKEEVKAARRLGVSVEAYRARHPAPPMRVFVPFEKRPPKGVIWCDAAVLFHAQRRHFSRMLGQEIGPEPARLHELREEIGRYLGLLTGPRMGNENWAYYRGRHLACPYRCPMDSPNCPVDVVVQELNKPSPRLERARRWRPQP